MDNINPAMLPAPGERLLRFVGDRIRFTLKDRNGRPRPKGWRARLRTNLGRAAVLRQEIIHAHAKGVPLAGESWCDLPMRESGDGWELELPLTDVGFFKAKAYLLDERDWQHWPDGPDIGISVHPDDYRTGNTIYCAFSRLFGPTRNAGNTTNDRLENQIRQIEQFGYAIIPPSGKFRDVVQCLPHIIDTLGCRILHLLPVHPTPTTYARFGRFGSPYAALDFTAVDPALVVFDKHTTGVDQFCELTYATHLRGGRVIIDIVINHTGWGSKLQEDRPEWFFRKPDGEFVSPGAWGTTWEDLVELNHINAALWDELAQMFLIWCRRGVDGFRCDAGYKVPTAAWQYIIARVQQEFPETVFLLEGLGGPWETTEALLTEGGMQWAYSELFQNYSGSDVSRYLDYALRQSERVGIYVHYSETHDNDRLAKKGRAWSLLRNNLCALTSVSGGFGFTCGVEWLAPEKILVHGSTGLAWNNADNLVPELARLNRLLHDHPCFFDGAKLTRVSVPDSAIYALLRESAEGKDSVIVLVNTDTQNPQTLALSAANFKFQISNFKSDLLGNALPEIKSTAGKIEIKLLPAAACCLSSTARPVGLSGDAYRRARAQASWAIQAIAENLSITQLGAYDWCKLAELVERSPFDFLAAIPHLDLEIAEKNLPAAMAKAIEADGFPQVVRWSLIDRRRITLVPPGHRLLIEDTVPFRATLEIQAETLANQAASTPPGAETTSPSPIGWERAWVRAFASNEQSNTRHASSIAVGNAHIACFSAPEIPAEATLSLERYTETDRNVEASIRFLPSEPETENLSPKPTDLVLLTNGIGGMARLCVDLGRVNSKYDCVLGANLHPSLPVDRHIFAKRMRVWVNANGFITPLDFQNLESFDAGPPAIWNFIANAGDGHTVEIEMRAEMVQGRNTTQFHFSRPTEANATGKQLPVDADVRLTVRVDIEDRSFHSETKRNGGAEYHFSSNTHPLEIRNPQSAIRNLTGFAFTPASDRQLRVFADGGEYHPQPEWSNNIAHPIEQSRGQTASGDAYSPGWFELPLPKGSGVNLTVTAEQGETLESKWQLQSPQAGKSFEAELLHAARAYVVRRGSGKTVIAGYPWFMDWGRDTFISARGLLAAGMAEDVKQILIIFARFEKNGTLPNTIFGDDASNRDTSDAPLWFGVVCEELAEQTPSAANKPTEHATRNTQHALYSTVVDSTNRTIKDVLFDIATNYMRGTPNGIHMDSDSALIWSPSHFTWMDTNYPAGTPREGYPIEIQALWIRLLRQLARLSEGEERTKWTQLAERALASVETLFWIESKGWYADVLLGNAQVAARKATPSDALRNNCLFLVSLGLIHGEHAKRCVAAALRYLVVPGALRSLAPLPVSTPLPVYANGGGLLNDPLNPYWPRYEGDEDTRRKPAYHSGTAWTWTFPVFCEAMARAWDFTPEAVAAARAYLGSMQALVDNGCLGQIPEILDGDAPHTQRGCDAQAWGVTEALRVWKLLNPFPSS